jgi:plastocyanin
MRARSFCLALALAAMPCLAEEPAILVGKIVLAGSPPTALAGVVWIPGLDGHATAVAAPQMESRDKRFAPHVVAIPKGAVVAFPNVDPIYHNVFSLSPGNSFDLGLYRKGAARSVIFKNTGLVRVYCNIHPEMVGYVMVVDSSTYAVAGTDGSFKIAGIPPGRHTVRVWTEAGGETSNVLEFAAGREIVWDPTLDASQYRPLPHKNKHGQSYPPATQDVDRY